MASMKEWKDTAERLEAEKKSLRKSLDSIQTNSGAFGGDAGSRRSPPLPDKVGLWSRLRGKGGGQRGESPAAAQNSDGENDDDTPVEGTKVVNEGGSFATATPNAESEKQLAALRRKADDLQTSQSKAVAVAAKQAEENAELAGLTSRLKQQIAELTKENKELKVSVVPDKLEFIPRILYGRPNPRVRRLWHRRSRMARSG